MTGCIQCTIPFETRPRPSPRRYPIFNISFMPIPRVCCSQSPMSPTFAVPLLSPFNSGQLKAPEVPGSSESKAQKTNQIFSSETPVLKKQELIFHKGNFLTSVTNIKIQITSTQITPKMRKKEHLSDET